MSQGHLVQHHQHEEGDSQNQHPFIGFNRPEE